MIDKYIFINFFNKKIEVGKILSRNEKINFSNQIFFLSNEKNKIQS
jgi:hypothetical protein